ncbi:MAG: leucine-rich repeat protein [Oscillospiraceae bacterium]|nr:leucine-rich repeat protein [Oscillospiraceae bacterium]
MKRRIISALLVLTMVLGMIPATVFAAENTDFIASVAPETEVPEGFTGIYDTAGLSAMTANPSGSYILMNDIAANLTYPLFSKSKPFTGVLDGNGYTISGLDQYKYIDNQSGFIAAIDGAKIYDLRVSGQIKNYNNVNVGGIVGYATGDIEISNCVNDVAITLTETVVSCGGIIGGYEGNGNTASISFCRNAADFDAPYYVGCGGIIGRMVTTGCTVNVLGCRNDGTLSSYGHPGGIIGLTSENYIRPDQSGSDTILVSSCGNFGTIAAKESGGGIVGMSEVSMTVEDCLNAGAVSSTLGPNYTGGIVGTSYGKITRCVNVAVISGSPAKCAIAGSTEAAEDITNCYWLDNCLRLYGVIGQTGSICEDTTGMMTADAMASEDNLPTLSFPETWIMDPSLGHPVPALLYDPNVIVTGKWGPNVTFTLYRDGLLHFTGSGPMESYSGDGRNTETDKRPWAGYAAMVTTAKIDEGITDVGGFLFSGHDNLTQVTIPKGVTAIGACAFEECAALTAVTLPDSLTSIGMGAFLHCGSLTGIHIPAGVSAIGDYAFTACPALDTITVEESSPYFLADENGILFTKDLKTLIRYPQTLDSSEYSLLPTVQTIACAAFGGNEYLRTVYFHDKLVSIGAHAFGECTALEHISLPESLETLGKGAFLRCTAATTINLPEKLTVIEPETFMGCTSLFSPGVPYGVSTIGEGAYMMCESMVKIALPVTVKKVDTRAFYGCNAIDTVFYDGRDYQWQKIEIASGNEPLTSAETYLFEFDMNLYQADYLTSGDTVSAGMHEYIYDQTPTKVLLNCLNESGMENASVYWESLKTIFETFNDPTYLEGFVTRPKDLYSAVILSTLQGSASDKLIESFLDAAGENLVEPMKEACEVMDRLYQIDLLDAETFRNLSREQQQTLQEILSDLYQDDMPEMGTIDKALGWMDNGLKASKSIQDFLDYVMLCTTVYNVSEGMETVLRQAYADSLNYNNPDLTAALNDCVSILDKSQLQFYDDLVTEGVVAAGKFAAKYALDKYYWKDVQTNLILSHPEVALYKFAYDAGALLTNRLGNTDAVIEKYLCMIAVSDMETLMLKAYENLHSAYTGAKLDSEAEAYLAAVDMTFALRDLDCVRAYEYVDAVDQSYLYALEEAFGTAGTSETGNLSSADRIKSAISTIQKAYTVEYETARTAWINNLKLDYPGYGLEYKYNYLLEESSLRIEHKEFVVACPVDVFVYDAAGTLAGYVSGDEVWSNGDILVAKDGGTKTVRLYDSTDYSIKLAGTASGDMDLTVTDVDADGNQTRTVRYYDIPLTDGTSYSISGDSYALNSGSIEADYDSASGAGEHAVSIQSGMLLQNGQPCLETTAAAGDLLSICAFIPDGYQFLKWEADPAYVAFGDAASCTTTFRMPNRAVSIRAVLQEKPPFEDVVENTYYYAPVLWAVKNGITTGLSATVFGVDASCTRSQFVTFLWRAAGCPEPTSSSNPFSDVENDQFYSKAVLWAVEKGITTGLSPTHFGVNDPCTRAQVVTFLHRYAGSPAPAGSSNPFTDVEENQFYSTAILWAVEEGITTGLSADTFGVEFPCNRAQVVTFLYRAMN